MYQQFGGSLDSFLLSDNLSDILKPLNSISGTMLFAILKACCCVIKTVYKFNYSKDILLNYKNNIAASF